jgi:hypothetical protein
MRLLLTDGTTTIDLNDGLAYGVPYDQWRPAVGGLRDDALGGYSPYTDVREEIPLHVRGATPEQALERVAALAKLLDQAERWARGERVAAVQLWYSPTNSKLGGWLKAAVLGRGRGQGPMMLGLSPRVNDAGNYEIPGVTMDIRHTFPWLFDEYFVENYCLNSSFEVWDGTNFASWTKMATPTISQSSSNVVQGEKSMQIVFNTALSDGIYQDVTGLVNGATYRVSCWAKPVSGLVRMFAFDGGGFSNAVFVDNAGTTLQRLEVTKVATAGGIRVAFFGGLLAEVYLDAVMVEEGTVATDYHPSSADTFVATATATGNPNVLTADFSVSGIPSYMAPVVVEVEPMAANLVADAQIWRDGFVGVNHAPSTSPVVLEAEDMSVQVSGSGTFAVVAVAEARGGDVRRLIPTTVGPYWLSYIFPPPDLPYDQQYAVLAMIRNNSAVTYTAYLEMTGSAEVVETTPIVIPPSSENDKPSYHLIGVAKMSSLLYLLKIVFEPSTTSASGLDVDFVAVVPLNERDQVVALTEFPSANFAADNVLSLDHSVLESPYAKAWIEGLYGETVGVPKMGNVFLVSNGMEVRVLPLLTKNDEFLYTEGGLGGTTADLSVTVRRKLAYFTPQ